MDALAAPAFHQRLVHRVRRLGPRRCDKAGPSSAPGVPQQGKLAHRQNVPAYVQQGTVHLPVLILKNAQIRHLAGNVVHVLGGVAHLHADQQQEPFARLPHQLAVDPNGSFRHSLHHAAHCSFSFRGMTLGAMRPPTPQQRALPFAIPLFSVLRTEKDSLITMQQLFLSFCQAKPTGRELYQTREPQGLSPSGGNSAAKPHVSLRPCAPTARSPNEV